MENILENGYSTFSQEVIKSQNLHIKSKAIYLFLCSYKNVEYIALPKRETIMNYLGIGSKETYYKYMKELENQGYITITTAKVDGKFFNNQYKINKVVDGKNIFEYYGIIPKKVMNDKNVSIEAKAVYGYFCCFRNKETNDVVYTNINQIKTDLDIVSNARLNKNIKMLIEAGYVTKKQHTNGQKFSSNVYHLVGYQENIKVKESELTDEEISEATQKNIEMRDLKNKTYKQVIQNENRLKKEIKAYESKIKANICYNSLEEENKRIQAIINKNKGVSDYITKALDIDTDIFNFTNDIINIIVKTVFSEREKIKIDNVEHSKIIIKEMFLKLKLEHIEEVLKRYRNALDNNYIKKPSAYIETVLYSVCFDYGLVQIRDANFGT